MPTVPVIAPRIADVNASDEAYRRANLLMLRNPTLSKFLDGCALSLPCHLEGEAPVGLMVAGTHGQDKQAPPPETDLSVSGAVFRPCSAMFGVP